MKSAVIFHPVEVVGGGEKLALSIARALHEEGYSVVFYTVTGSEEFIKKGMDFLGVKVPLKIKVFKPPLAARILGKTGRFSRLRWLMMLKNVLPVLRELRQSSLVLDTRSNMLTDTDIVYIHYPVKRRTTSSNSIWWIAYDRLVRTYVEKMPEAKPCLVLANSSWTARKAREMLGTDAEVLHPPVDVEYFSKVYNNPIRDDIVITLSRFTPEKHLEKLLPVARVMRKYEFIFVGATGKFSKPVLETMNKYIVDNNIRNVRIITDVPRKDILYLMKYAKIYLHPPFAEHFGIAIVEAMAAGLVPIIYCDGGAWADIVSKIDKRLCYRSIDEIPALIKYASENYERLSLLAHKVARSFSYTVFKQKFIGYVKRVEEAKQKCFRDG